MADEKNYRSKIDRLICQSGLTAVSVAKEMGVRHDRLVALRRAKCSNISSDDYTACVAAIARLHGKLPLEPHRSIEERLNSIEHAVHDILDLVEGLG